MFGIGDDFCLLMVFGIWFVYFSVYYFYVVYFVVGIDFNVQWLNVKLKFDIFFVCVFYFVFGIWYVFFIMMISIGYVCCVLVYGSVYVVYCGIVVVQYYYVFVFYVDIWFVVGFVKFYDLFCIGDQEWQSVENFVCIFIFQFVVY